MKNKKMQVSLYILASIVGAVASFGITIVIYEVFGYHEFLVSFNELSDEVLAMITRDPAQPIGSILANIAHGFLLATMILWTKSYKPLSGAAVGAVIGFFTEIYFCFTQYTMSLTMNIPSAICDTIMWTCVCAVVGALVAWILSKGKSSIEPFPDKE